MEVTALCHALFTRNKKNGKTKCIKIRLVSMRDFLAQLLRMPVPRLQNF